MNDEPRRILIVRGISELTPDNIDAVEGATGHRNLANSELIIGTLGSEVKLLKWPEDEATKPIIMWVDMRDKANHYRQEGEALRVVLGDEPRSDDVRTAISGIPIRGVVKVTVEDDFETGRAVTFRTRMTEVVAPEDA